MLLLVIFTAIYYNKWKLVKAGIRNLCGRAEKLMINILPPEISMDGKMKRKKTNMRNRK